MTTKKNFITAVAISAAMLCGATRAEEPTGEKAEEAAVGWQYNPGEGLSFNEQSIVSAEFSLAFDSKYLSYGLIDNNDPILTPDGSLTFFDWLTVGVYAIIDTTHYGYSAGYYNRRWSYQELDPYVSLGHEFGSDDFDWLPTTIGFEFGYQYERHPESFSGEDCNDNPDTQFATFTFTLPDLWFEPAFLYERDIMRDHGTYLNLEVGHEFALIDGDEEGDDAILTFRPSVGQGWGDRRRISGYLSNPHSRYYEEGEVCYEDALERNGLMDTAIRGTLTWNICDYLSLSGYVQYSDYIFDRHTRDAARVYEATGRYKDSWNFTCGLALTASF